MSSKIVIDVSEIQNAVRNKTFGEVKKVMEEQGIRVRESTSDVLENLYLLVCESDDTCTDLQVQCNGIILEKESNKVVCMAQNKIIKKIKDDDMEDLKKKYEMNLEYCEDGTVIRLYNYNKRWYTATTKCIDARHSYWSSDKTFDEMFWSLFDEKLLKDLHEEYTYSFILLHKENRIVVNHQNNQLVYVSRTNNITKEDSDENSFCFVKLTSLEPLSQGKLLEDYYSPTKRGVILKCLDKINGKLLTYQYDFKRYEEIKNVRGNVPLLRMRYLELLSDPESLELLEKYYPENQMLFAMIKHCVGNLYREIHQLYYNSHIKHSVRVDADHPLYRTLTQLHGIHKKQKVVISLEEVKKKVDTLDKLVLRKLLRWV